jgi:hypothetical protein
MDGSLLRNRSNGLLEQFSGHRELALLCLKIKKKKPAITTGNKRQFGYFTTTS